MPSRLLVTDHFLQSDHAPQVCVFSGRPTGGFKRTLPLKQAPEDGSERSAIKSLVKDWKADQGGRVAVPQAPGAYAAQRLRDMAWLLPLVGLPVAGVLIGMRLDTAHHGNLPGVVGGIGAVVGVVLALALKFWAASRRTVLRLMGRHGVVEICFPTHLRAAFDEYKAAYGKYRDEMARQGLLEAAAGGKG
ncbi:MAG: hypothetical protein ACREJ2_12020 [Planctomycetota bacterium]